MAVGWQPNSAHKIMVKWLQKRVCKAAFRGTIFKIKAELAGVSTIPKEQFS